MTAHDDLATLLDPTKLLWAKKEAAARVEAELARLEAENEETERIAADMGIAFALDHIGLDGLANEVNEMRGELARLREDRDEAERLYDEAEQRITAFEARAEAAEAEARVAHLEQGLRRIVNVLGPDYFAGELEGLLNEGQEALNTARALLEDRAVEAAVGPAPTEPGASHASESSARAERDEVARLEAELARLEANERHLTNLHDWRAKGEQEQKQRAVAAEAEVARLREGLRGIAEHPISNEFGDEDLNAYEMRSLARSLLADNQEASA